MMASLLWVRVLIIPLVVLITFLAGCGDKEGSPLSHDVYIWQRQWSPAVTSAMAQTEDLVRAWKVLGAYTDPSGHLHSVAPDWNALRTTPKPVILVIRIEGRSSVWNEDALLSDIEGVLAQWREIPLAGLEIDHDSPTARLVGYGHFLARLRQRVDGRLRLSVTGLPTWLSSPELDEVVMQADEFVLQVHGTRPTRDGLFNRQNAMGWIEKLSARTRKPFRVALPSYGVRLGRRDDGAVVSLEAEAPVMAGGVTSEEVMVPPEEVQALVQELERRHLPHLAGVVWFRLPTDFDKRSWSLATLRAVITATFQQGSPDVMVEDGATPGMVTVALANRGAVDVRLPLRIVLPDECRPADGINVYGLEAIAAHPTLRRNQDGVLPGHHRQVVGWARCAPKAESIHVEP
jgi:hypothetical protein